jgi:mRNA-degrading endonuclease RelE of RelBE toxin-antitoxin system
VKAEWSPRAIATASRFLEDRTGLEEVLAAVDALTAGPCPPEAFRWGDIYRLHAGRYRIMYVVEDDVITIQRVDRVTS